MRKIGWALGVLAAGAGFYPVFETQACRLVYGVMAAETAAPESADVIVVFGGGGGSRIRKGLDLLAEGYAPRILFLGTGPEMEFAANTAYGVRRWGPGRLRFGDEVVSSTSHCARHLAQWARRNRVKKALVVSDADHLGRVSAQLEHHSQPGFTPKVIASGRNPGFEQPTQRRRIFREALAYGLMRLGSLLRGGGVQVLPPTAYLGA